jgi:hypothetical protein
MRTTSGLDWRDQARGRPGTNPRLSSEVGMIRLTEWADELDDAQAGPRANRTQRRAVRSMTKEGIWRNDIP